MEKTPEEFDLFDFVAEQRREALPGESPIPAPESDSAPESIPTALPKLKDYQQLVLGFVASLGVDALAERVAVKGRRPAVQTAGFWRAASGRKRPVVKTVAVLLVTDRELCFADCADREEYISEFRQIRERMALLEVEIRRTEPHLAAADDLFDDLRTWDYAGSSNPEYQALLKRRETVARRLNSGSRLDRIAGSGMVDLCYLAVPAGLIAPEEIPEEWGVLELAPKSFTLLREAPMLDRVTPEGRAQLAFNIAQAALAGALFTSGVERSSKGSISYRLQPKRRRRR